MGGIEEELLRCGSEDDMRIADLDGYVPPFRRFLAQGGHQLSRILEGLRKQQPSPAAINLGCVLRDISVRRVASASGVVHSLAFETMGDRLRCGKSARPVFGCGLGHHQIPCVCIHISRSPTCQSSDPRSGVI